MKLNEAVSFVNPHFEHEERGRWTSPFLSTTFCRHGGEGDNESLTITLRSDRLDPKQSKSAAARK
jgi:hypothetical protein